MNASNSTTDYPKKAETTIGNSGISGSSSKDIIKFDGRITEAVPVDIYLEIFKRLQISDIINLSSTNKSFHKLLKDYSLLEKIFIKKNLGHNVILPEITSDFRQKTMAAFIKNKPASDADMLQNSKSELPSFYFHYHRQMALSQEYQFELEGIFQHNLKDPRHISLNSTADHALFHGVFREDFKHVSECQPEYIDRKFNQKTVIWGNKRQSADNNWQQKINLKLGYSMSNSSSKFNLSSRHILAWTENNHVKLLSHDSEDTWHEETIKSDKTVLTACLHPSEREVLIASKTEVMILDRINLSKYKITAPTDDLFPVDQFDWGSRFSKPTDFNGKCCYSPLGHYAVLTGDHFISICVPSGDKRWSVMKTFTYRDAISSFSFNKLESYLLVCSPFNSIKILTLPPGGKTGDWSQIETKTLTHPFQGYQWSSHPGGGVRFNDSENEILVWGKYGVIIWKRENHDDWSYHQIADHLTINAPTNADFDHSNNHILASSCSGITKLFQRSKDDGWPKILELNQRPGNVVLSRSRRHIIETCSSTTNYLSPQGYECRARVWGLVGNKRWALKGTINHDTPICVAGFNDLETHIITVSSKPGSFTPSWYTSGYAKIWAITPKSADNETNTVKTPKENIG